MAIADDKHTYVHETEAHVRERGLAVPGSERLLLTCVVLVYALLSVVYAVVVPWGEVPDEPAHERYVEYLVRYGGLPVITGRHPYTNESQQPPLYYVLGASAVRGYRLLSGQSLNAPLNANVGPNPDALNPPKPNVPVYSVLVHDSKNRYPPYAYLLRGLSVVLGVGSILLTYAAARRLVPPPASPAVALGSALCVAFIPQRMFVGIGVTNDNLVVLVAAWLCYLIARQLTEAPNGSGTEGGCRLHYLGSTPAWMGLALGLGLLSKYTIATFVPILLWVIWTTQRGNIGAFLRMASLMLVIAGIVAGPFLVFNTLKYGDPVASRAVAEMLPKDSTFQLGDLFWLKQPFAPVLWTSFWGVFGWQRLWMPGFFYDLFAGLTLAGIAGGARLVLQKALSTRQAQFCAAMLAEALIIYSVIVIYSLRLIAWQGRELYPALPGICILIGLGVGGLLGGRQATEHETARTSGQAWSVAMAPLVIAAVMVATNAWALVTINEVFANTWR